MNSVVFVLAVIVAVGWLILKGLSHPLTPGGPDVFSFVHSRDPRERAAARDEAAEVLKSDAGTTEKLRAIAVFRQKATLAVLDGWSDVVFTALCDEDARLSTECARLIDVCVDHGILASQGISAVAMTAEDARRLAERIDQTIAGVPHASARVLLKTTHGKLVGFVETKPRRRW